VEGHQPFAAFRVKRIAAADPAADSHRSRSVDVLLSEVADLHLWGAGQAARQPGTGAQPPQRERTPTGQHETEDREGDQEQ
jgi:hypothetical protein